MNNYYFNRELRDRKWVFSSEEGCVTLTEQPLISESVSESDETYPLRYKLLEIQRFAINLLREKGFGMKDVCEGARHFRSCIWQVLDEMLAGAEDQDERESYDLGGLSRPNEDMRSWVIYSDTFSAMEAAYEITMGLETSAGQPFEWADFHLIASLWSVDEATYHINQGQPYKAAVWAMRADKHHEWSQLESVPQEMSIRDMSKKALDAKHESNRAAKQQAIEIYKSRTWISLAAAGRHIAKEVSKNELTVLKWIREYRKGVSLPGE